jgi:hypothetical protein
MRSGAHRKTFQNDHANTSLHNDMARPLNAMGENRKSILRIACHFVVDKQVAISSGFCGVYAIETVGVRQKDRGRDMSPAGTRSLKSLRLSLRKVQAVAWKQKIME